jgi:hypothetical protein
VLHLNQNSAGNQNLAIDFSKNIRIAKTNEIVERDWYRQQRSCLRLLGLRWKQPMQCGHVLIEVLDGVVVDFMLLLEGIHLHAYTEAENLANLFHRQPAITVFAWRQSSTLH